MTPADLDRLQGLQADAGALDAAVLRGLLQGGWGRTPVLVPSARHAEALDVLTRWVRLAPLQDEAGVGVLLQARGALRRLLSALGGDLEQVLRAALAAGEAPSPDALVPEPRYKLALLADARCALEFDLAAWGRREPVWAMLFAIQALDAPGLLPRAQEGLRRVVEVLPQLPVAPLPLFALPALQRACFLVSYVDSPLRYAAKAQLVAQAGNVLAVHGRRVQGPRTPRATQRPHLLVVGEGLDAGHAMWRFYAEPLRELRRHFHVSLLGPGAAGASVSGDLADAFVPLAHSDDPLRDWAAQVLALRPDVVFYPGIGMSFATFTLSLQRLAPLQVASTATPAPSCSPEIDAMLLFDALLPPAGSGPVIGYDHHVLRPANAGRLATAPRAAAAVPCIGVNAVAMKLNDSFLATIEAVLARFDRPCRLRFLPNVAGAELQGLMRVLLARFPGAEVLPSMDHASYLQALGGCDLVLQSFPFGGANTTTDALDLGLPVVALGSPFLSGQTDRLLLRARGLEYLCATDREQYVEIALRLLQDAGEAQRVRERLAQLPLEAGHAASGTVSAADAIFALWQQREGPAGGSA